MTQGPSREYTCSFCGNDQGRIACLVVGRGGVCICDECIILCHEVIEEQGLAMPPSPVAADRLGTRLHEAAMTRKAQLNGYSAEPDPAALLVHRR
jgi:ATP-dependent protease Clp ATPase subunit